MKKTMKNKQNDYGSTVQIEKSQLLNQSSEKETFWKEKNNKKNRHKKLSHQMSQKSRSRVSSEEGRDLPDKSKLTPLPKLSIDQKK